MTLFEPTVSHLYEPTAPIAEIRFLRLPQVREWVGISKVEIYELIRSGAFPKPVKHGRASFRPDNEIAAWQRAKMEE